MTQPLASQSGISLPYFSSTPSLPNTVHDSKRRKISSNRFIPSHIPEELWGSDTEIDEDAEEVTKEYSNRMPVVTPKEDVTVEELEHAYRQSSICNRKESYEREKEQFFVLEVNPTITELAQEIEDEEDDAAREEAENASRGDESDSESDRNEETRAHYQGLPRLASTPFNSILSRRTHLSVPSQRRRLTTFHSQRHLTTSPLHQRSVSMVSRGPHKSTFQPLNVYESNNTLHTTGRNPHEHHVVFSSFRASESPSRFHRQEQSQRREKRKRREGSAEQRVGLDFQRSVGAFKEGKLFLRKG